MFRSLRPVVLVLLAAVFTAIAVGCGGGYTLSGRVVRGETGFTTFVSPAQLDQGKPVAGAQIMVYRDPDTPKRSLVGKAVSDGNGNFEVFLDGFGVGWMDEMWEIRVDRPPYDRLESLERLPSAKAGRGLLITLRPGFGEPDDAWERDDLIQQYEKFRY